MLKKRLLIVMCLFVSLFLFNITNISAKEFEITNSYEFNENVDYGHFYGIAKNDATTFVVVGSNQQNDYNNKIAYGVIAKYNVNGEKIWENINTTVDRFRGVAKTTDNNFVAVGQKYISENSRVAYIVKYNTDGTIMWSKTYGAENFNAEFYKVVATSDNGAIAIGFYTIAKFDENGNVVWEWTDQDKLEGMVDIKPTSNGYVVITNHSFEYAYEESKLIGRIYVIDDAGTIKQTIDYKPDDIEDTDNINLRDVVVDTDNNLYILYDDTSEYVKLIKYTITNNEYTFVSKTNLEITNKEEYLYAGDILITDNNQLLIAINMNEMNHKTSETYEYKTKLLTYSMEGVKESEQVLTGSKTIGLDIYEIMPVSTNNYMAIGTDMLTTYLDSRSTLYTLEYKYDISKDTITGGTVSTDVTSAFSGTTVTLTATPNTGKVLDTISVYKKGDSNTKVTVTNNTFTMPDYDVVINATFKDGIIYTNNFINSDTGIEAVFEDEYDDRYKLVVDNITTTNKNIIKLYDIKLVDENGEEVHISNTKITIKIPIGDILDNYENIKVKYINGDNEEEQSYSIEDGYLIFTTTHLSNYAIEGTLKGSIKNPKTYDSIIDFFVTGSISFTIILLSFVYLKHRKTYQKHIS